MRQAASLLYGPSGDPPPSLQLSASIAASGTFGQWTRRGWTIKTRKMLHSAPRRGNILFAGAAENLESDLDTRSLPRLLQCTDGQEADAAADAAGMTIRSALPFRTHALSGLLSREWLLFGSRARSVAGDQRSDHLRRGVE